MAVSRRKKPISSVGVRQAQAVDLVHSLTKRSQTPDVVSSKVSKVNEIYNATSSVMEITDETGKTVLCLGPYERREIDGETRSKLETLEHYLSLAKRDRVRFFV